MQPLVRVRLVLYAVTLGLLAVVLLADPFEPDAEPAPSILSGVTETGQRIFLHVADRRVQISRTWGRVPGRCSDGQNIAISFHPRRRSTPMVFDRLRFSASEATLRTGDAPNGDVTVRIVGQAHARRASGTVHYVGRYRASDGTQLRCESPRIRWTAD